MKEIIITSTALILFVGITIIYWLLTSTYAKKEYGNIMWIQWSTKLYYWSGALLVSGGITAGLLTNLDFVL